MGCTVNYTKEMDQGRVPPGPIFARSYNSKSAGLRPVGFDTLPAPIKFSIFFLGTGAQDRDESLGVGARFIDLAHNSVPEYFYNSGGG